MDQKEIDKRFTYHPPQPGQPERYTQIRTWARSLAILICQLTPESREQSLAITNLEDCVMHANAAIARNEPAPPEKYWPAVPDSNTLYPDVLTTDQAQAFTSPGIEACTVRGDRGEYLGNRVNRICAHTEIVWIEPARSQHDLARVVKELMAAASTECTTCQQQAREGK